MKKVVTIALLVVLVVSLATTVKAATASERLYSYLTQTFKIAGQDVKVPQEYLAEAERYLTTHEIEDTAYYQISYYVDCVVEEMDKAGITDFTKLEGEARTKVAEYVQAAADVLGLTVDYDANTQQIKVLDKDGSVITTFSLSDTTKLTQTDLVHYGYIAIPAVAIIAVALVAVYKKIEANV